MSSLAAPLLPLLLLLLPGAAAANDVPWPDYRGPARDGHAPATADVPLTWSESENVRWKTAIHGQGWSSPVVAEGRAWMTTATEDGRAMSVIAVDVETGEVVHDAVLFENESPAKKNATNSYASPSPTVEAGRVYVTFGTYGTACLDAATGEPVWTRRDIHCNHMEGPGSSPFLHGDLLYLHFDGGDKQFLVALDTETGKLRWHHLRDATYEKVTPDMRKAYSTPVIAVAGGREQLISSAALRTYALDPETGEEIWHVDHPGFSMSARPLVVGAAVVLNTGFAKPELWAVATNGAGDVTETHVLWTQLKGVPTISSAILVGDHLYCTSDQGVVSCFDAGTGKRVARTRISDRQYASPIHAAGRIHFFGRDGRTTVLAPMPPDGGALEVLAENDLAAGCMATPAVVGDAFLVRTKTHLYRIEAGEEE